jgi:hypothetical protein
MNSLDAIGRMVEGAACALALDRGVAAMAALPMIRRPEALDFGFAEEYHRASLALRDRERGLKHVDVDCPPGKRTTSKPLSDSRVSSID